jgi:putative heme transporter
VEAGSDAAGAGPVLGPGDVAALEGYFRARPAIRDLGRTSWLLLGAIALLTVVLWTLGKMSGIVTPVIAGFIVACVASPLVARFERRGLNRGWGAVIVLLALLALGVLIGILVIGGISAQAGEISKEATSALDKATSWLKSLGVDSSGASKAADGTAAAVSSSRSTFIHGIVSGIQGIASLAFFLSFTFFSIFFLLKDGPKLREWVNQRMGAPLPVARVVTGDVVESMRRYFLGVTIVAAFNGVVVGLGAWALGVPLAGTIAVVTFVTAYIPFIGAFVAGAFAVVLALGAKGVGIALVMLVIVLLANGLLQNIVQPIAFGATLNLHPLVTLVVTIGAGALFGMAGLILAAPLTSAISHIVRALSAARTAAAVPDG